MVGIDKTHAQVRALASRDLRCGDIVAMSNWSRKLYQATEANTSILVTIDSTMYTCQLKRSTQTVKARFL